MEFSQEQLATIVLHLLPGVTPKRFHALISCFGSAARVLEASADEFSAGAGIAPEHARAVREALRGVDPDKEVRAARAKGAEIITYLDARYPQDLKHLYDFPPVLYLKGAFASSDRMAIAVVGTRRPTAYGINAAERFSRDLAASGVSTVSGLARGIDTAVHEATLAAGGRTIAVLGCGMQRHYPPENARLEERISRQGVVVSEFPMETPPDRGNFPRRNRLIAALSLATVVVEADIKSGALITARLAAEQGKDVFAVPGPVFSPRSSGPHYLIKSGARLAESARDVLDEIGVPPALRQAGAEERCESGPGDPCEKGIMALLTERLDGVPMDELSSRLSFPRGELAARLLELELRGLIRGLPGNVYVKRH